MQQNQEERIHIFTGNVPIRWRDIDPFGMVNHAVLFTLMEEVRLKWFETTGLKNTLKYFYPIVDAQITFEKTINYPSDVSVSLYTGRISEKSWTFYHEIFNTNNPKERYAKASLVSVVYDPTLKHAVPIPLELTNILQKPQN